LEDPLIIIEGDSIGSFDLGSSGTSVVAYFILEITVTIFSPDFAAINFIARIVFSSPGVRALLAPAMSSISGFRRFMELSG
jgi:hypothetical protein